MTVKLLDAPAGIGKTKWLIGEIGDEGSDTFTKPIIIYAVPTNKLAAQVGADIRNGNFPHVLPVMITKDALSYVADCLAKGSEPVGFNQQLLAGYFKAANLRKAVSVIRTLKDLVGTYAPPVLAAGMNGKVLGDSTNPFAKMRDTPVKRIVVICTHPTALAFLSDTSGSAVRDVVEEYEEVVTEDGEVLKVEGSGEVFSEEITHHLRSNVDVVFDEAFKPMLASNIGRDLSLCSNQYGFSNKVEERTGSSTQHPLGMPVNYAANLQNILDSLSDEQRVEVFVEATALCDIKPESTLQRDLLRSMAVADNDPAYKSDDYELVSVAINTPLTAAYTRQRHPHPAEEMLVERMARSVTIAGETKTTKEWLALAYAELKAEGVLRVLPSKGEGIYETMRGAKHELQLDRKGEPYCGSITYAGERHHFPALTIADVIAPLTNPRLSAKRLTAMCEQGVVCATFSFNVVVSKATAAKLESLHGDYKGAAGFIVPVLLASYNESAAMNSGKHRGKVYAGLHYELSELFAGVDVTVTAAMLTHTELYSAIQHQRLPVVNLHDRPDFVKLREGYKHRMLHYIDTKLRIIDMSAGFVDKLSLADHSTNRLMQITVDDLVTGSPLAIRDGEQYMKALYAMAHYLVTPAKGVREEEWRAYAKTLSTSEYGYRLKINGAEKTRLRQQSLPPYADAGKFTAKPRASVSSGKSRFYALDYSGGLMHYGSVFYMNPNNKTDYIPASLAPNALNMLDHFLALNSNYLMDFLPRGEPEVVERRYKSRAEAKHANDARVVAYLQERLRRRYGLEGSRITLNADRALEFLHTNYVGAAYNYRLVKQACGENISENYRNFLYGFAERMTDAFKEFKDANVLPHDNAIEGYVQLIAQYCALIGRHTLTSRIPLVAVADRNKLHMTLGVSDFCNYRTKWTRIQDNAVNLPRAVAHKTNWGFLHAPTTRWVRSSITYTDTKNVPHALRRGGMGLVGRASVEEEYKEYTIIQQTNLALGGVSNKVILPEAGKIAANMINTYKSVKYGKYFIYGSVAPQYLLQVHPARNHFLKYEAQTATLYSPVTVVTNVLHGMNDLTGHSDMFHLTPTGAALPAAVLSMAAFDHDLNYEVSDMVTYQAIMRGAIRKAGYNPTTLNPSMYVASLPEFNIFCPDGHTARVVHDVLAEAIGASGEDIASIQKGPTRLYSETLTGILSKLEGSPSLYSLAAAVVPVQYLSDTTWALYQSREVKSLQPDLSLAKQAVISFLPKASK